MVNCKCQSCGKLFEVYPSIIKKGSGKYCSRECGKKKVDCICLHCGSNFQTFLSEVKRGGGKFCSSQCYQKHKSQEGRTSVTCQHCQKRFTVTNSALDDGRGVFCSQKCCTEARSIERICEQCGGSFFAWRNQVNQGKARFCTRKCVARYLSRKIDRTCKQCGKSFAVKRNQIKKGVGKFCSLGCHGEWKSENLTGENSPTWKGGSIKYYGPNWRKQQREVRKRDGNKCKYCGKTEKQNEKELDIHHIKPFREFGYIPGENENYKEANKPTNLISLCKSCHMLAEHGIIAIQPYMI